MINADGAHTLEVLQCMVERRRGEPFITIHAVAIHRIAQYL